MKKQRILKLADYMEKVQPANYRQASWLSYHSLVEAEENDALTVRKLPTGRDMYRVTIPEGSCNTVACVLGHGVTAIPEAKLYWYCMGNQIDRRGEHTIVEDVGIGLTKNGVVLTSFEAGAEALGIHRDHAEIMFGLGYKTRKFYLGDRADMMDNPTPTDVAAALRKYVETNGKSMEEVLGY